MNGPVNRVASMRELQPRCDLANVFARDVEWQRAVISHDGGKVVAIDELHHDVRPLSDSVRVVCGNNVRMNELRHRSRHSLERLPILFGLRLFRCKQLDGCEAIHGAMSRLENLPRCSVADPFENRILADEEAIRLAARDSIRLELAENPRVD